MRRALFAATIFLTTTSALADWAFSDLNRTVDSANFVVNEGCSGTLIDLAERLILTAEHCVDSQYETIRREKISEDGVITEEKVRRLKDGTVSQLAFKGSESVQTTTYKVRLLGSDKKTDLALLKVVAPIPNTIRAQLACEAPVRGEPVYIVGNPMGVLYSTVHTGIVSSTQRDYRMLSIDDNGNDKAALMQISGGVIGGNSGGSVFNSRGELVGVPVRASRMNEVLGFAVPLSDIKEFLKAQGKEAIYAHCAG